MLEPPPRGRVRRVRRVHGRLAGGAPPQQDGDWEAQVVFVSEGSGFQRLSWRRGQNCAHSSAHPQALAGAAPQRRSVCASVTCWAERSAHEAGVPRLAPRSLGLCACSQPLSCHVVLTPPSAFALFISEFIALESTSRAGSRKAWLRGQQASTGRAGVKARPLSAATRPGQAKAGTVVPSPEPPRCGCSGQHVPKKRLPAAEPDRGLASPVTPWSQGGRCDSHTHIQVAN